MNCNEKESGQWDNIRADDGKAAGRSGLERSRRHQEGSRLILGMRDLGLVDHVIGGRVYRFMV